MFRLLLRVRSEVEKIVHWMPEILFATQVALCCLHGCMPEQELNLLQLSSAVMTQLGAGAPQIMGCNMFQACSLAAGSDHVPDHVLRDATAPHLSQSGDRSKDSALTNPSGSCPLVERVFDPDRNGHRPNVATFANQINHGPVSLTHLDVVQLQTDQLRSSKATAKQHSQHRVVALGTHAVTTCSLEYFRTLLCAQPIAGPESELLDSFDTADPGSQLGTQQSGVSSFVSQATHGCQLLVDGVGGQMPRFQVHAIAHNHNAVKASRGSEHYQAMNWSMAYSYTRREAGDPRLLRTADLQ